MCHVRTLRRHQGSAWQMVSGLNSELWISSREAEANSAGSTIQPAADKGDRFAGNATEGAV
jgi:hypothetical protein